MSMETRPSVPARLLATIARGYQLVVSPWFAASCKYYPSCSSYAMTSLRRHGALRGMLLGSWRLLRCNPWSDGGVDYPPAAGAPMPWSGQARTARSLGQATCGAQSTSAPKDS